RTPAPERSAPPLLPSAPSRRQTVVFSVIITLVSFTSSPSNLHILLSSSSRLRIREGRHHKGKANRSTGGIHTCLPQGNKLLVAKEHQEAAPSVLRGLHASQLIMRLGREAEEPPSHRGNSG